MLVVSGLVATDSIFTAKFYYTPVPIESVIYRIAIDAVSVAARAAISAAYKICPIDRR